VREIARQVGRLLPMDGVVIAHPDLEAGRTTTALRLVRGVEEAAADDVVGDAGPASSVLAVPMLAGIQLVGVIAVHASQPDAYSAEDEEVLLTVGAQAAIALTNARLYAESQRERRQSEALADVARAVSESLRLGEVLHLILRHSSALLKTDGACVLLKKEEYLHTVAAVGCAEPLAGMLIPVAASLSGRALREGRSIISNDASGDNGAYKPAQHVVKIRRTAIVPLITARGAIGVLSVINRAVEFTDEDARVLQRLADQVAVAIVNAGLYEEVAEATREWRVAFDAIGSGMAVLDEEGRVVRCNRRALQLAGVPELGTIVGREFHDALLHERHAPGDTCPVEGALEAYTAGRATLRSTARGLLFDVLASPHPNGGAVVTFDDVTSQQGLAERYRRVVETASDAIVITDLERRIAFCNPAAHELLGGGAEIIGRPVSDFVAPERATAVRDREDRAFAGEPQRYEAILQRLDGERRMVSISTAPLRDVGQVTGVVASLRDVTAERRARDAVAQSEARYRNLFETASDAIYTLDAKGFFTSANAATAGQTGVAREALLGRSIVPFLDPEEVHDVKRHFRRALAGNASHYECHMVTGTRERRLVSVTNTPIRQGEQVVGVLGVARDVTLERERAAALERSEQRYTRLVESASDAIFTVDEEGCFTAVNRSLEQSTGYARETLIGMHLTEVIDPRDRPAAWELFVRTMQGSRQRGEMRYRTVDGASRSGSVITAPILEGERVVGGLGVMRDITDEKRLLEQLLQQEKLAAVGQLASGVAHELNNPLAGVMAFSQLLLATPGVPDDARESAETIHAEARRAAKIVSNLLTFARQHQPERAHTDVNAVLRDTIALRRYALQAQGITVIEELATELPPTWADAFQLQQVFLNLLGNAEQAVAEPAQERRIRIRSEERGDRLVVAVRDSGPGIAPADVGRIFNPFYTTKPVGQGTGLGLSIADGIVREHGGRIQVESAPGAGAEFIVELPIVAPPDDAAPTTLRTEPASGEAS
jgi:PAS domain S-box-containing protein